MLIVYSNKMQPPTPLSPAQGQPEAAPATSQQPTVPDQKMEEAWRFYQQAAQAAMRGDRRAIDSINRFHHDSGQRLPHGHGFLDKGNFQKYWIGPRAYLRNPFWRLVEELRGIVQATEHVIKPIMQGTPLPGR
jgi:hypothetical protein